MAKYEIPIVPNSACFVGIGELAARWGWIENQTAVLIRELLRLTKPEGHMAISAMGIRVKTRVMANLARHMLKTNKLGDEIQTLAKAIEDFDDFRNDVIHGLWVHHPVGTTELALLRRKSLQQKVEPVLDKNVLKEFPLKIAELHKIQNESQRITTALKSLRGKFS